MKIKDGFILRRVADNNIVISVGDLNFDGIIQLNDTGVLLWKKLEEGCETEDLLNALLEEYDVTREVAEKDVNLFLQSLRENHLIHE